MVRFLLFGGTFPNEFDFILVTLILAMPFMQLRRLPADNSNIEYICECLVVLAILLMIEYSITEIINSRFPFLIGKTALYKEQ